MPDGGRVFRTEEERRRADFDLLRDAVVSLYWRGETFEDAKRDLRALDYRLFDIPAEDRDGLIAELSAALRWQDLFGYEPWSGNLDALADAFYAVDFPAGEQVAFCIKGFHSLVLRDSRFALGLLDVISRGARTQLLHGRRVLALVQTDDAEFNTDDLGGMPARWNDREWFNADRGL